MYSLPLLSRSIGLPLPWLIYSFCAMSDPSWGPVIVYAEDLDISIAVLIVMLVGVIATIAAFKWKMTKMLGVAMMIMYIVFLVQDLWRTFA